MWKTPINLFLRKEYVNIPTRLLIKKHRTVVLKLLFQNMVHLHFGLVEMDSISFVDVVVLGVHRYLVVVAQVHRQELIHNDVKNRHVKNNGQEAA